MGPEARKMPPMAPSSFPRLAISMKMMMNPLRNTSIKAAPPIYELRTYNLVPKEVGQFMELSKEKFHLRTQHSVLLGYWTSELGGLNQVVHIWQYDSFSHRARVRATLGADP